MLTSLQNSLVKQIRKLHQARARHEQQMFLLEGTHLIQEALAAGYPLHTVCSTESWQGRHPEIWAQLCQQTPRSERVSPAVMKAIATTVEPDGILAIAERQPPLRQLPITTLGLALATIQDPGNLGGIIRTAAAAGAEGLWLSHDSVDLDHPKVMRASAGQWFRLPMAVSPDLRMTLQHSRGQGFQVLATVPTADLTYWQVDLRPPTLIVLGNEGAGLLPEVVALADRPVRIPLSPGVESLNVTIAAALILYEVQRQRGFNPAPGNCAPA
ncbi:rRNA methyltransferase [Leptolyngbya sp. 'hensonii']|uniref:TrmH family RNA methyltransferase n=1 Tax=Leptolyngbya sp. 'hensonii' TaxID=1922337 RepID=UPI00094FDD82|nr:RNA methyltransferase [Leptolyngbya sp. 'hensonii']OLP16424.1 rRNA methyltransferase [Leptolyngbya sp. 'hensonii']